MAIYSILRARQWPDFGRPRDRFSLQKIAQNTHCSKNATQNLCLGRFWVPFFMQLSVSYLARFLSQLNRPPSLTKQNRMNYHRKLINLPFRSFSVLSGSPPSFLTCTPRPAGWRRAAPGRPPRGAAAPRRAPRAPRSLALARTWSDSFRVHDSLHWTARMNGFNFQPRNVIKVPKLTFYLRRSRQV